MYNMKYKDYKPEIIAKKLKDVEQYEAVMGKDLRSKAWRKWCESAEYRKKEWQWRQNVANYALNNAHKAFMAG